MVSFNVDPLYTKVLINDVLEFFAKLPDCDIDLGSPVDTFIELVNLFVTLKVLSFNNYFYIQSAGIDMSSPLSPN